MKAVSCPLCGGAASEFHRDRTRAYLQCSECRLVFVPPEHHLSAAEEKSRYALHRNSPDDAGYRRFLSRMLVPMTNRLPAGSRGLDFGSGPGPTLSVLFEERGFPMEIYDPFFAADESVLNAEYDFVTATEVAEHLRDPLRSLDTMWRCVRSGGYLGIMTKLVIDRKAFSTWHYTSDDTHICFYSRETFRWLAHRWRTEPEFAGKDVILFHKPSG